MKKRLFCLLLALSMAAVLTACGGEGGTPSGQNTEGQDHPAQSTPGSQTAANGYVFAVSKAGGYTVAVNDDMADVLAALGEPISYFEAASCAFEGMDKTYTYSGFVITTQPGEDGHDYVNFIRLTDDSVSTPEGVYIGCSADEVTAAYGEGSRSETVISYTKGKSAMNFILEGDKVISIEYLPA